MDNLLKAVQNAKHDFLNFYKYPVDMPVSGKFDIPVLKGIRIKRASKLQTVAFDECHLIPANERKNYIVHFYIYDYKFERVWTFLNKNTEFLKQFKAVISPDFSEYTDMPRAMCIWNAWRCNFVSWWWQNAGIKVIPSARWSDEKSYEYSWDGMPTGGCYAVSSKGNIIDDRQHEKHKNSKNNTDTLAETSSLFKRGFEEFVHNIKPEQVFWMGAVPVWLDKLAKDNDIEVIIPIQRKLYEERLKKRKQVNSQ